MTPRDRLAQIVANLETIENLRERASSYAGEPRPRDFPSPALAYKLSVQLRAAIAAPLDQARDELAYLDRLAPVLDRDLARALGE